MKSAILRVTKWVLLAAIVLLVLSMLFVKTVIVPRDARIDCDKYAREQGQKVDSMRYEDAYDFLYTSCFRQKGLEAEN